MSHVTRIVGNNYQIAATKYIGRIGQLFYGDDGKLRLSDGITPGGIFVYPSGIVIPDTIYSAAGTPLPAASMELLGAKAVVSDATLPTFLSPYVSGGTVAATVLCNGTQWVTA